MIAKHSKKKRVVFEALLSGVVIGVSGCGMDEFLGLEDYQRDLLLGGLVASLSNSPGNGGDGRPLPTDGINCWDLNGNGSADPAEDRNGDGVFDARDCQGAVQVHGGVNCWDLNGNGVDDPGEDRNGDGTFDALDCQGAAGPAGPMGPRGTPGRDGPAFFDVFVDDFFAGDGTASGELQVVTVRIDEPALGGSGSAAGGVDAVAYRVAIPRTFVSGNDVTMRLFLYRTGVLESGCFVFALDANRFRPGGVGPAYGETKWIRVVPSNESPEGDAMLVVDVPINQVDSTVQLGFPSDLRGGDFLGFELTTSHRDGRTYQILGAEFFEGNPGSAELSGAVVFHSAGEVHCDVLDCNGNGLDDDEELAACPGDDPLCQDCNGNGQLDECDLCDDASMARQVAGSNDAKPFTFLQDGFTQALYATAAGFMGGIAFAPDGDVLVDRCPASRDGSPLRRFDVHQLTSIHGNLVHPLIATLPSEAGCGLTNHPDGTLYSNTDLGITNLDAESGALLRDPFGEPGNSLGIAVDPQTREIVYVGSDGTLFVIDEAMTTVGVWSTVASGTFVDGIAFDPSGEFLFLAGRDDKKLTILRRDGSLVQHVPIFHDGAAREPDAVAIRTGSPSFLVTANLDGTITRFDFPGQDYSQVPTQSLFAEGGFRGDLLQVGADRCLYLTQDGTRYADGTESEDNSVVQICGGFEPPIPGAIELAPQHSAGLVGRELTLIAAVRDERVASLQDIAVTFAVLAGGPNAGIAEVELTDAEGRAVFAYTGGGVGMDRIQARFEDRDGTKYSNIVTVMWFPADCSLDCNANGIPDECDIVRGTVEDCQGDGIADVCGGGCE